VLLLSLRFYSLLLTEKKHIIISPDYDRLILVFYKLPFDPLRILVYVIYKLPFGRSTFIIKNRGATGSDNYFIAIFLYEKSYYKRPANINNINIIISFTGFSIAGKDKISNRLWPLERVTLLKNDNIRLA
jgi:hypothetical protein